MNKKYLFLYFFVLILAIGEARGQWAIGPTFGYSLGLKGYSGLMPGFRADYYLDYDRGFTMELNYHLKSNYDTLLPLESRNPFAWPDSTLQLQRSYSLFEFNSLFKRFLFGEYEEGTGLYLTFGIGAGLAFRNTQASNDYDPARYSPYGQYSTEPDREWDFYFNPSLNIGVDQALGEGRHILYGEGGFNYRISAFNKVELPKALVFRLGYRYVFD